MRKRGPGEVIISGIRRETSSDGTNLDKLPRVDRVVERAELRELRRSVGQAAVTKLVREAIESVRQRLLQDSTEVSPSEAALAEDAARRGVARFGVRARRVINATGVLLHTNLGRAPLSQGAGQAVADTMSGYAAIELDLETGKRGRRGAFLDSALAQLSGAASALVVNNCAAAVLLLLATVARGRSVVVSRGELVEIGGGFRVPDVMAESGARLVEVGTTNKTRIADYQRALDENTDVAAILRVHPGNFRQTGFVERPSLAALASLARAKQLPLLKDLGGGALVELADAGFVGEPTVQSCLVAGANAVTFSTDKVLGGPQGGAIVGDQAIVDRVRKHPLMRALRLGRLPLVALEETLRSYMLGDAWSEIPALAMASESPGALRARATALLAELGPAARSVRVVDTAAEMGGGSLAGRTVPSAGLAVAASRTASADALMARLRRLSVIARVFDDEVILDLRTVAPSEEATLVSALRQVMDALEFQGNGQEPATSSLPSIASEPAE